MAGSQYAEKIEWLYLNSCTDLRTARSTNNKLQPNSRIPTPTGKNRDGKNKDSKSNQSIRSSHSLTGHRSKSRDPNKLTHNVRARKAFKKVCSSLLKVEDLRKEREASNECKKNLDGPVTCKEDFLEKLNLLAGGEAKNRTQEMSGDSVKTNKPSKTKPVLKADTSTSTPALKSISTQSQVAEVETEEDEEAENDDDSLDKSNSVGTHLAVAGIFLLIFFCVVKTVRRLKR